MNILFFGTSITWGAHDRQGGGYAERLKRQLFQPESGNYVHAYNLGISGENSDGAVRRLESEIAARLGKNPAENVIVLEIGTNDSAILPETGQYRVPIERYEANMRFLISTAKTQARAVVVLSIPPIDETAKPPAGAKIRSNKQIARYDAVLRRVAEEAAVDVLDVGTLPVAAFDPDGLHLNAVGHGIIAETVGAWLEANMAKT